MVQGHKREQYNRKCYKTMLYLGLCLTWDNYDNREMFWGSFQLYKREGNDIFGKEAWDLELKSLQNTVQSNIFPIF